MVLTIEDEYVENWFHSHPGIDASVCFRIFVKLLENVIDKTSKTKTDIQIDQLMSMIQNQTEHTNYIKETIDKFNDDIRIVKDTNTNLNQSISNLRDFVNNNVVEKIKQEMFEVRNTVQKEMNKVIESDAIERGISPLLQEQTKQLLTNLTSTSDFNERQIQQIQHALEKSTNYDTILNHIKDLKIGDTNAVMTHFIDNFQTNTLNVLNGSLIHPIINEFSKQNDKLCKTEESLDTFRKEFQSSLNTSKNSTIIGKDGETKLEKILNTVFPMSEIVDTSSEYQCGDFFIKNLNSDKILIENKDYSQNVANKEIQKFIRDIDTQKCDGIFLSQSSGISEKDNFQIDQYDGHLLLYLHNVNYSEEKIKTAVKIIQMIRQKMNDINLLQSGENQYIIDHDVLKTINNEYLKSVEDKTRLIEFMKNNHKKEIQDLCAMTFPALDKFLDKYFSKAKSNIFTCSICGVFTAKNNKGLITHMRYCKAKQNKNHKPATKSQTIIDLSNNTPQNTPMPPKIDNLFMKMSVAK